MALRRFRTVKTAALFAYLACYPDRPHSRDSLCHLLWPDDEPNHAASNLSTSLWWLRRELAALQPAIEVLRVNRNRVEMDGATVERDSHSFEADVSRALRCVEPRQRLQALHRSFQGYTAPLLNELDLPWVELERQRLAALYQRCGTALIAAQIDAGDFDDALTTAFQLARLNPVEESYVALVQLLTAHRREASARNLLSTLPPEVRDSVQAMLVAAGESTRPITASKRAPYSPTRDRDPAAEHAGRPPGGALSLHSNAYVSRAADSTTLAALRRQESIILVKGARQTGKSSLLAHALQDARARNARAVASDFEALNSEELATPESLFAALADHFTSQLSLAGPSRELWTSGRSPAANFERFLRREVFGEDARPLVWALDGVDRLFICPFGAEAFRLFRSWHNARALEPTGPWSRLSLVIAYASEVHLFIRDLNQSPFNVGTHVVLEELTPLQVKALNQRLGAPLADPEEVNALLSLVGGQPYLVQQALHVLKTGEMTLSRLIDRADSDDGPFGNHLRALTAALNADPDLKLSVRKLAKGICQVSPECFYRLRAAGVVTGESEQAVRLRCRLYERYLARHWRHAEAVDPLPMSPRA